jgi:cytoskeletal protein CcmA (bactofilin family)
VTEERKTIVMANSHHQIRSHGLTAPNAGGQIAPPGASRLAIDAGQSIVGDVSFSGTVQVDGRIEGDVSANRVVISASAVVDGAVKGRSVYVDGTVNGPIDSGAISLASTACVKGNITYETMTIASGASIVGLCSDRNRVDQAESKRETPSASQPLPFNKIKKVRPAVRARAIEVARPAEPAPRATPQSPMTMRAVWDAIQKTDEKPLS